MAEQAAMNPPSALSAWDDIDLSDMTKDDFELLEFFKERARAREHADVVRCLIFLFVLVSL